MDAVKSCEHFEVANKTTQAKTDGCEECMKLGDTWVALRLCLDCGHVGCCDSSKNQHATKHFHQTKHPVMTEYPGRGWSWCYVHEQYLPDTITR